jgi:pyrrolidone-carboxylate peptidase
MPVSWEKAPVELFAAYDHLRPVITIASGLDNSVTGIRLESRAVNQATGKDVDGVAWTTGPIDPTGPESMNSLLPIEELRLALEQRAIRWGFRRTPGTSSATSFSTS